MCSSEISRAENAGLSDGLALVEEAKKEIDSFSKGGPISYADLIQLAGDDDDECSIYLLPKLVQWTALLLWNWNLFGFGSVRLCRSISGQVYLFSIGDPEMRWKRRERELTLHGIWFEWSGTQMLSHLCVAHFFKWKLTSVSLSSGLCLIDSSEGAMQQSLIPKVGSHCGEKQLCKRWKISSLPSVWDLVRYMIFPGLKNRLSNKTNVATNRCFGDL